MLTVPTWDLVGVIADCVPFAFPKPDLPNLFGVRVEWDGERLHALAMDGTRVAWSQWHPSDDPPTDTQDELGSSWGGDDGPWGVFLGLDDAKKLVEIYKLPLKQSRTPLTVAVDLARLTVSRAKDTGHSAIRAAFDGVEANPPDVRKLLAGAATIGQIDQVAYNPSLLADFAKVRSLGRPMELRFTTSTGLTHVAIGSRFAGAIMPINLGANAGGEKR